MQKEILGFVAGSLTTISVVPQVFKTWKKKDASDVSLRMFCILLAGVSLWTLYGFVIKDFPVILTNSVSVVLNSIMIVLKLKYSGRK